MRGKIILPPMLAAALGLMFSACLASADPGVDPGKIVFGQAAALEGQAAALGTGMRDGLLAAFGEANRAGGVHGRKLELISRDDGYEPLKSIDATKQLITDDKVFALVGAVGTPTSAATQPVADDARVPFIGAFTGAEFLRNPFKPNVVNIRASYYQETEEMIERLTRDRRITRVAILFQDDSFGRAGLAGTRRALEKRQMSLVSEGTFERNSVAVRGAMLTIRKGNPEAVIMIGPYRPCAEFIKLARDVNFNPLFVNISFVGSNAFAKELGEAGAGVVVTQVVPFPEDSSLPLVARYRAALEGLLPGAEPGFVSLEGYMVGRLLIAALEKMPGEPSRQGLLDTIHSESFDLGGVTLHYGKDDNQGMDHVYLTEIQGDGSIKPIATLRLAGG
ncbi:MULTISPECIES: ABC transporter substrate-binding protein [Rhodomicrobium]|uniref:ABC transporter substrate-binding protein n=1 Tax=Rhodomicrobium TaxID=1068 RepID=UPI000B4A7DF2|nr:MULTISPECIES: ABC transporter substrate-binding protein [Rhodomicrobium]